MYTYYYAFYDVVTMHFMYTYLLLFYAFYVY
jgi:hypothetical protein